MNTDERFARLWTRAQPLVASYVASLVADFHEADDIVQDVAVVLVRKFGEYDESRSFLGWAMGIARNEILQHRRAHARAFLSFDSALTERVAAAFDRLAPELEFRTHALRHCLGKISDRPRQMLSLLYEDSLKPRQIAERLGIAAATVRVMLSKARSSLRTCVERKVALSGGHR